MTRLYVGNIPYGANEVAVKSAISALAKVIEVRIVYDRQRGTSKGFGFVDIESDLTDPQIDEIDGLEMDGRNLRVQRAMPEESKREDRKSNRCSGTSERDRSTFGDAWNEEAGSARRERTRR